MTARLLGTENIGTYRRYGKVVHMGLQVFDERSALFASATLDNAAGTTPQDLVVGQGVGTRIDVLQAMNNDSGNHIIDLFINDGVFLIPWGTVNVPGGAGYASAQATDMLINLPLGLNAGLVIPAGMTLVVQNEVTTGMGNVVTVTAFGGQC